MKFAVVLLALFVLAVYVQCKPTDEVNTDLTEETAEDSGSVSNESSSSSQSSGSSSSSSSSSSSESDEDEDDEDEDEDEDDEESDGESDNNVVSRKRREAIYNAIGSLHRVFEAHQEIYGQFVQFPF